MSGDQKGNPPWGDAFAPEELGSGNAKKTIWIQLGPVWLGESGAMSLELKVEPLHWREYGCPRRIVIMKRETKDQARDPQSQQQRGGNRR